MVILPKAKDIHDLKEYLTDSLEKFSGDNDQFHKDFKVHNEIIRRYDEVISKKASKVEIR